jgi:hypothetical protein
MFTAHFFLFFFKTALLNDGKYARYMLVCYEGWGLGVAKLEG